MVLNTVKKNLRSPRNDRTGDKLDRTIIQCVSSSKCVKSVVFTNSNCHLMKSEVCRTLLVIPGIVQNARKSGILRRANPRLQVIETVGK